MGLYAEKLAQIAEQLKAQGADFEALTESLQALQANAAIVVPSQLLAELDAVFDDAAKACGATPVLVPFGVRA